MDVEETAIAEVLVITPRRLGDARGYFEETWNRRAFADIGIDVDFVQDNHSLSAATGVIRGLHFQHSPAAQGKLIRVVSGRIYDVAVDVRPGSPTYGAHVGIEISAESGRQMWVPAGFAHGFCTLEPDTAVVYKVTSYYDPNCDRGIAFDDPEIGIDWPVDRTHAVISDRDRLHPRLAEVPREWLRF